MCVCLTTSISPQANQAVAQHLNADILSEGLVLTGPDGTHLCDIDGLLKAKNEDKFFLVESKMTVQVITAVVSASVWF